MKVVPFNEERLSIFVFIREYGMNFRNAAWMSV
jgi:hypothetical protein